MADYDLDELLRGAEIADTGPTWGVEQTKERNWIGPLRSDGSGKVRFIVTHTDRAGLAHDARVANDVWAQHIANMDPPTTIAVIERLQRAEMALRHIWNHPLRDECAADDLRWMARTALNYKDETALRESADAGQEGTS